MTGVYDPKAFILHAASLCHTFVHCKRSSTAASRRSLGSVSVPVWVVVLSDQLPVSLGGPLPHQLADGTRAHLQATGPEGSPSLITPTCVGGSHLVLAHLSAGYSEPKGRLLTRSSPFRHYPLEYIAILKIPVRLACLIHAASVRSEPESNSP